ncbi:carcinoembryonic antigen-related cell adhesion molecule 19 [Sarcophilus harrisii]|uniref:carcinoembryonic antigen-related cell adhesion molecule 19 n=1 Tax=Sarcophilus harrisii TaxID=9305 RepID=UPI001302079C|nr:carcinoembryonic antigen-related cell adhesion molecule 19 [Sarcophilus harrisii]
MAEDHLGSMLPPPPRAQDMPTSGITINPDWTVRQLSSGPLNPAQGEVTCTISCNRGPCSEKSANTTKLQHPGKDGANLGLAVTVALSCLGLGALLVGGGLGYLLLTGSWRRKGPGPITAKQDLGRHMFHKHEADNNQYEVSLSPSPLRSPTRGAESSGPEPSPVEPQTRNQEAQEHHYEELQDPDPAPYCQLSPTV